MTTSAPSLRPIAAVAADLGIADEFLEPYGRDKAKVRLEALNQTSGKPPGKLILVSAITPTPAGEGKTTTSIGLAQGLRKVGKKSVLALRQPSMGPVFGRKGGATGGGACRLTPSDQINLQFTGDFHAITAAHNLLAAALDNKLHFGTTRLDPRQVFVEAGHGHERPIAPPGRHRPGGGRPAASRARPGSTSPPPAR